MPVGRSAAWDISRRIPWAYGRSDSMRSCARRSFADATSSMARVIFAVLRTESIRRLMSRWVVTPRPPRRPARGGISLAGGGHDVGECQPRRRALGAREELVGGL